MPHRRPDAHQPSQRARCATGRASGARRDLKAIDQFPAVLAHLAGEQPALQTAAAWVIGSAAQNHRELQLHLLELGALPSLLHLVHSHQSLELRAKALCARP